MSADWSKIASDLHGRLLVHAERCKLCCCGMPIRPGDPVDAMVSTACSDGMLLISEYICAVNHSGTDVTRVAGGRA